MVDSEGNQTAVKGAIQNSLNENIKDELACTDEIRDLNELRNLAICLDNKLTERNRQKVT